ncbi:LysR substrate-binding domain-containing protein [Pseudomonas asplenii]|uniref:LysR substrate-binding domain-containing protein n=1 Tax=Pseudomonas asplenii TaxID=53407 RepID=UPI0006B588B6|nr:LysR substrate-binding domain-containing protein [Pseudomonas fuscovaginae]KPA98701.1 transcriptional regulator [Pseudomonas fuscovaginae]
MFDIPPTSCLRSFEAVARLGSVTAAARELHVTHSAVSQQIKLLEETLGVTLLAREGRGVRVTEDGRLYALQIREALGHVVEATRSVKTQPAASELVVAVVPSFGAHWLVPRLPGFQALHPDVNVRLQASLAVSRSPKENMDIGIRMGRGDWEGVESRLLFQDESVVVAAPHFNGGRLPGTPAEIVDSPIIFSMESWQPWCQAAGLDIEAPRRGLRSNDSNLVLRAVTLGQGIALERRSLVHDAIQRGELVQLSEHVVPYPYPYWLVQPLQSRSAARRDAFAAWLLAEAEQYMASAGTASSMGEPQREPFG